MLLLSRFKSVNQRFLMDASRLIFDFFIVSYRKIADFIGARKLTED